MSYLDLTIMNTDEHDIEVEDRTKHKDKWTKIKGKPGNGNASSIKWEASPGDIILVRRADKKAFIDSISCLICCSCCCFYVFPKGENNKEFEFIVPQYRTPWWSFLLRWLGGASQVNVTVGENQFRGQAG